MNGALETYGTISKVLTVSLLSQNERRKKLVYYPSTKKKKKQSEERTADDLPNMKTRSSSDT